MRIVSEPFGLHKLNDLINPARATALAGLFKEYFMRSSFFVSLAVILSFCCLTGCSHKDAPSSQSDIQAFSHPPPATPAQRQAFLQGLYQRYKKTHPEAAGKLAPPPGTPPGGG
jgi:hypothetical protein